MFASSSTFDVMLIKHASFVYSVSDEWELRRNSVSTVIHLLVVSLLLSITV